MRGFWTLVIGFVLLFGTGVGDVWGRGRIYRNADLRLRQLEVPRDWRLVQPTQIGYPGIVLVAELEHARLVLGVQPVGIPTKATELATEASRVFVQQGRGEASIEPGDQKDELAFLSLSLDGGKRLMRQAYRVCVDLAYVLTLVTPKETEERALRDFELTLRSLELEPPKTKPGVRPISRCR